MPILMNNCQNRDHERIYNHPDAFYDIEPRGVQADRYGPIVADLRPGGICIVATKGDKGRIHFTDWEYTHEETRPDDQGEVLRVFFGKFRRTVILPKADAANSPDYARFFDVNGNFKQASVIRA